LRHALKTASEDCKVTRSNRLFQICTAVLGRAWSPMYERMIHEIGIESVMTICLTEDDDKHQSLPSLTGYRAQATHTLVCQHDHLEVDLIWSPQPV